MQFKNPLKPKPNSHYPWRLAGFLYLLTWGPIVLFLQTRFWDDWYVFYTKNSVDAKKWWNGEGFPPYVYEVQRIVLRSNPIAYHLVSFIIYFILGWLTFRILTKYQYFATETNQRIAILSSILPINSARVSMIMLPYTISLFVFMIAWNMWLSKRKLVVAASLLVFLFSFYTWSLIPFLILPAAGSLAMYLREVPRKQFRNMPRLLLILLAPTYYIFSNRVWPPAPERSDYFTPQLNGLFRAVIVIMFCLAFSLWLLYQQRLGRVAPNRVVLLSTGLFAVAFGSVAYFASGRLVDLSEWISFLVPNKSDWSSRSQLLHGFGWSLFVVGVIGEMDSALKRIAYQSVVGLCVLLNLSFLSGYVLDALKQESVIKAFSESELVNESKVIMIDDSLALPFNARGRGVRSYEWEGMLLKATGDAKTVVYDGYIDCSSKKNVPDLLVTIYPQRGRLIAQMTMNAEMILQTQAIAPCG